MAIVVKWEKQILYCRDRFTFLGVSKSKTFEEIPEMGWTALVTFHPVVVERNVDSVLAIGSIEQGRNVRDLVICLFFEIKISFLNLVLDFLSQD